MKLLYAIQGTGNGHISRAKVLIPLLKKHADVDILISGAHSELKLPFEIDYHYTGLGFYFGKKGGIDLAKTFKKTNLKKFYNEIKNLPVHQYDAVLNDFEPVSAWAAKKKAVLCLAVSHQSALLSPGIPKPDNEDLVGEMILKNYAPFDFSFGFHFKKYARDIHYPMLRAEIMNAKPKNEGYYLVYLPSYSEQRIKDILSKFPEVQWKIFSKHSNKKFTEGNINIHPIHEEEFTKSLIECEGVICGAGFETPAEAIHLGKKLLAIPMKNQYEQKCNAEALTQLDVPVIKSLKQKNIAQIKNWLDSNELKYNPFPDESTIVVQKIITMVKKINNLNDYAMEM